MDESGFHNPYTVPGYLTISELYLRELEHEPGHVNEDPAQNKNTDGRIDFYGNFVQEMIPTGGPCRFLAFRLSGN